MTRQITDALTPAVVTRIALAAMALWAVACLVAGIQSDHMAIANRYQSLAEAASTRAEEQLHRLNAELGKLRIYPLMLANQGDVKQILEQFSRESDSPRLTDHPHTLKSTSLARLNQYLQALAPELQVSNIFLVTRQGYILSTSSEGGIETSDPTSFSFREYFQEAMEDESGEQFAVDVTSGKPGFFFSNRVEAGDADQSAGVAVVRVNGEAFADNFAYWPSTTFITDGNGVVMLSTRQEFFLKVLNEDAVSRLPAERRERLYTQLAFEQLPITKRKRLDNSDQVVNVVLDDESVPHIYATRNVPETDWHVNVLYPVTGLAKARQYNALVIFSIFIAGGLVILLIERILRYVQRVREQARRDPLTRLYNRYHMVETITPLLAMHERGGLNHVALLLMDLDHFKEINDRYGHPVGDRALQRVADTLTRQARQSDIVYRVGGEEFMMLILDKPPAGAMTAATRIRKHIEEIDDLQPIPPHGLTISGGIAMRQVGESLEQLMKKADDLLYTAKQQGRNRIITDKPDTQSRANDTAA